MIAQVYADAVVFDEDSPLITYADLNDGVWLIAHVFGGVLDQILENLSQTGVVTVQ